MEDYKANVNILDESGKTPLHWACKFGLLEICKFGLLEICKFQCKYLVDEDTLDKNKKSPLDMAVSEHKWEIGWFLEDTYRENWSFLNCIFPYWNYIFSIFHKPNLIQQIPSEDQASYITNSNFSLQLFLPPK